MSEASTVGPPEHLVREEVCLDSIKVDLACVNQHQTHRKTLLNGAQHILYTNRFTTQRLMIVCFLQLFCSLAIQLVFLVQMKTACCKRLRLRFPDLLSTLEGISPLIQKAPSVVTDWRGVPDIHLFEDDVHIQYMEGFLTR